MAVPGIKVVAPSTPADVVGLMAAAVRDADPVLFFEHKGLYAAKGEVPDGEIVDRLGTAKVLRAGGDCTIVALGLMVPRALAAAERLAARGHRGHGDRPAQPRPPRHGHRARRRWRRPAGCSRSRRTRRRCGWGAEVASIVADEAFWDLDGPIVRITTPHLPLPAAGELEDLAIPSVERVDHDDPRVAGLTGEGAG